MTVSVLLTDSDDGSLLVECLTLEAAQDLASAAVFSEGGVSAWLMPHGAVPFSERLAQRLRAGHGLSTLQDEDEDEDEGPTYKIVRGYRDSDEREEITTGLTLEEAQAHCNDPETSSSTCTSAEGLARTAEKGPWFDRYVEEE